MTADDVADMFTLRKEANGRIYMWPQEIMDETIKEFSSIDGAFVIRRDGVIMAAGRYLQEMAEESAVPSGLGARHSAAAGITAATSCVAFAVSESTGDTRVFGGGRLLMTIEKND